MTGYTNRGSLDGTIGDARVTLNGQTVSIRTHDASIDVPVVRLDEVIRLLSGMRVLLGGSAPGDVAAPSAAAPTPPRAAAPPPPAPSTRKRRSRKRVGDALVAWMESNPGWHSEERLLEVVIANKMTDASPKRALKIALGKQRGEVFEGDGQGHWKLMTDTVAGAPPDPNAKAEAPARKPRLPATTGRNRAKRLKARSRNQLADDVESPAPAESAKAPEPRTVLVKRGHHEAVAPQHVHRRTE